MKKFLQVTDCEILSCHEGMRLGVGFFPLISLQKVRGPINTSYNKHKLAVKCYCRNTPALDLISTVPEENSWNIERLKFMKGRRSCQ